MAKPIPILPELLAETDYNAWFDRVSSAMDADGLGPFLTDQSNKPEKPTPNDEWWVSDNRAKTILLQSISRPISSDVMRSDYHPIDTSAYQLLRMIQASVTKTKSGGMTGLEWTGRWHSLRRSDFASWHDYTVQFEYCYKKLVEIGTPVPELFAIRVLLSELAKSAPKFADTLRELYDKREGVSLHGLVMAVNCLDP